MSWRIVAIHHSASFDSDDVDAVAFDRFHRVVRGWRAIGYHYVVEKVRGTYQAVAGRPLYMVGSHLRGSNRKALGICFAGDYRYQAPPEEQLVVGAKLIAGLCVVCGIEPSSETIIQHRDRGATECPGEAFPISQLVELVIGYYADREV